MLGLRQIGRFDVVFCRYALSHMTEEAQRKVVEDLTFILPDDGVLVLGLKEQIAGLSEAFQPVDRPAWPVSPDPRVPGRGGMGCFALAGTATTPAHAVIYNVGVGTAAPP